MTTRRNRPRPHLRDETSAPGRTDDGAPRDIGREAETPSDIPARGWKDILKRTVASIKEDNIQTVAAGLAFYTMLAIFPALVAFVSIYGLVSDPANVQNQIETFANALPSETASLIESQLTGIVESSAQALGWATAIAILGAMWSASSGMHQGIKAINLAYDEEETRGFMKVRGIALGLTLAYMVIAMLSLGLILVVPRLLEQLELGGAVNILLSVAQFVLLAIVFMVGLALLYRYAPDRDEPSWQWLSWGAVIATVVWIIASIGFTIFVSQFGNYQETYGALAGVIILLLWFFISAFVVLTGAELNAEMEHQTRRDTTTGPAEPMGRRGAVKADTVPKSNR
jgi:membrane protein